MEMEMEILKAILHLVLVSFLIILIFIYIDSNQIGTNIKITKKMAKIL